MLPMIIMAFLTLGWFASIVGMVGDIFDVALGDLTGIYFNGLTLEYILTALVAHFICAPEGIGNR